MQADIKKISIFGNTMELSPKCPTCRTPQPLDDGDELMTCGLCGTSAEVVLWLTFSSDPAWVAYEDELRRGFLREGFYP